MNSKIAIVQSDANFADQLALTLRQDGHEVLPIAHTIEAGYKHLSIYNADICVIDGTFPEESVMRFSGMLTLMDVPHIINFNEDMLLQRSTGNDGLASSRPAMHTTQAQPPMTHAISMVVWELHVGLQISKSEDSLSPAMAFV